MIKLALDQVQVGIVTSNPEPMLAFYGETLGLVMAQKIELPGMGTLYFFQLGSNVIKLMVPETPVSESNLLGMPQQANGVRYWTVQVNNLDELVAAIKQAGIVPLVDISEIGDVRFAILPDPDGNCMEFVEMPNVG